MARTSIEIAATPETVWSVLADPGVYGEWVVGTTAVDRADAAWPAVGSALEYRVGIGPLKVADRTVVLESEPPRLLVLRAELRRLGAAAIRLALEPLDGSTRIVMDEEPTEGIAAALHTRWSDAALRRRNDVSLDRLRRLAEERA